MNRGAEVVKFGNPNRVIQHACCVQFGSLGTIERCRETWEHTEGDLGVPGLDFYRFGRISGPPFWSCLPTLERKLSFLACVLAGQVFNDFGV